MATGSKWATRVAEWRSSRLTAPDFCAGKEFTPELLDPELESKAERVGFEESFKVGWRKGGLVRLVIARAKYRVVEDGGTV